MRRMDELHLEFPFAGSRMLRDLLKQEGIDIGRRHVSTLMKRMGIEALYRKPNTSKPAPGHKIYPYLLRGMTIDRPNQVWAMDITYVPMARGFVYLAAVVDWFSRRVLSWRLSITLEAAFCIEALEEALARHGLPEVFNTDQGSSSPATTSPACCSRLTSRSAWMARAPGGTTSLSSDSGDRSNTRRCISGLRHCREARASIGRYLAFTMDEPHSSLDRQTPDQAYFNPLPQSGQPNPGRAPLIAAANAVQINRATSQYKKPGHGKCGLKARSR